MEKTHQKLSNEIAAVYLSQLVLLYIFT